MWRNRVFARLVTKKFVEDLLLGIAVQEALYDIFEGLVVSHPEGFGRSVLKAVFSSKGPRIIIPPSKAHGRDHLFEIEVLPHHQRKAGKCVQVWRPERFGLLKNDKLVISKSNTKILNSATVNRFLGLIKQYEVLAVSLRKIGIILPHITSS